MVLYKVKWLSQLEPNQVVLLSQYREKWLAKAATEDPKPSELFEAYRQLARQLSLSVPTRFRSFSTFAECASSYCEWSQETGSLSMYWTYQLPLLDPTSYWRQWSQEREYIHLETRRFQPDPYRAMMLDKSSPTPQVCLTRSLNETLWKLLTNEWPESKFERVAHEYLDIHTEFFDQLDAQLYREDPTAQISGWDMVYLGPFDWLVQEVAYADFLSNETELTGNPLYEALETIARQAVLLLTFEKLLIIVPVSQMRSCTYSKKLKI